MEWGEISGLMAVYFRSDKPGIKWIREKYGDKFVDLNGYANLSNKDIATAALEACEYDKGLIIPGDYEFWNKSMIFKRPFLLTGEVELNTPQRFKKFGSEINLFGSNMTKKRMKEGRLTPRKLFSEKFSDPAIKEKLLNGAYRGYGHWNFSENTHVLTPFDVPAEGQKYRDLLWELMEVVYQFLDCYIKVPSTSRPDRKYEIVIRVLPVTEKDDEYFVEWTKTVAEHVCEDRAFKSMKSKMKAHEEFEGIFKFANPEIFEDRHTYGARIIAEDMSYADPELKKVLVKHPRATGIIKPWYVLKAGTIIGTKSAGRRPLKTEIGIACGWIMGHPETNIEELYDLEENL
jgi:hypothetical protein